MNIQTYALGLVSAVTPLLVQLVKLHLLPTSGKAAQLVSAATALGAVAVAHFALHESMGLSALLSDGSIVWAVSQLAYRQLEGTALAKLVTPGR